MKSELIALNDFEPGLAWILGGALVALLLFFLVLPYLQRRLRIFSRGTIAFMISALMAFTVVDGIIHLNEIRNSESRLRERARFSTVSSLLQSYFNGGPEAAIEQVPYGLHRDALAESLRVFESDIVEELLDRNSPAESTRDLRLVSLDVGRELVRRTRLLNPAHYRGNGQDWGFLAVIDDGESLIEVEGLVRLSLDGEAVSVMDLRGKLGKSHDRHDRAPARLFQRARAYANADYAVVSDPRGTILLHDGNR